MRSPITKLFGIFFIAITIYSCKSSSTATKGTTDKGDKKQTTTTNTTKGNNTGTNTQSNDKPNTNAADTTTKVFNALTITGKTINLTVNQKFNILFTRECVGCAQVWTITNIDNEKVVQLGDSYSRQMSGQATNGGSQDHTFHFQAIAAGKSTLSFTYMQSKVSVAVDVR